MSHTRGQPVPNYQDGEYTATAGGETIVPIHGPGTGTSNRLRRSASGEQNPDSHLEKPPPGSTRSNLPPPAFVQDDKFFNEKITLPRLAVNEREHITAENYDNEDRGSLDNEEQSYDRTVRYSQSRSGSLPARRFEEQRSSYFDLSNNAPRSRYYESSGHTHEGGRLTGAPWTEFEQRHRQLQERSGSDQQQFSKQTTHQTMEKSHTEQHDFHRNFYGGGGHRHHRERHSGEGGKSGYAYEEWHDGDGTVANYYRPEHTSTLREAGSSKHQRNAAQQQQQQQQYVAGGNQYFAGAQNAGGGSSYSYHHQHRSGASTGGGHRFGHSQSFGGYRSGGGAGYYKERKYHKVRCCFCFPCVWPPWAFEETHPPRPMYYSKPPPPRL